MFVLIYFLFKNYFSSIKIDHCVVNIVWYNLQEKKKHVIEKMIQKKNRH